MTSGRPHATPKPCPEPAADRLDGAARAVRPGPFRAGAARPRGAFAAEGLAADASAASVAPQVYQQAVAMRKRVVWSDLRKGVIMTMIGLAFLFYWMTESGSPSWVGLVLLFVGVGYVVLWWLESRHLE